MPICTLHLLSLSTPISQCLQILESIEDFKPLVISRVVRWIITPEVYDVDRLLHSRSPWHLLLIVPGDEKTLPRSLEPSLRDHFSITAGIPSRIVQGFSARNAKLLSSQPPPEKVISIHPSKIAPSAQNLELSADLQAWITSDFLQTRAGHSSVSMLNLLAFHPDMKSSYLQYGKAFAESIGSRHGGQAKIVGNVIYGGANDVAKTWDEVALAHYPSIMHFANMLASEDYQAVNKKFRVPALNDTCILCTTEVDLEDTKAEMHSKL